jgi:hypothetical protein
MNTPIIEYAKSSQYVCFYSIISMVLIFLFMISPMKKFIMTSFFGKLAILSLLGYTLYYNFHLTNKLYNQMHIVLMDGTWSSIKTNITCSYVFSFFLFVLFLSVLRYFF